MVFALGVVAIVGRYEIGEILIVIGLKFKGGRRATRPR
jgi:hypothetical protein